MATVEELLVKISADTKELRSQMDKAEKSVSRSTKDMKKSSEMAAIGFNKMQLAAVAAGAAVIMMGKNLLRDVDNIQKLSIRLGESTEELSRLKFAAEQSGVSFETATMAFQRMQRRVSEAASGFGEAKDALKELNIDAKELNSLTISEQFQEITRAMEGVASESERTRLAMKLFDSEGVALAQIMDQGAEALKRLKAETPNVITQEDANRIAEFNDQLHKMKQTIEAIVLPALTALIKGFNKVAKGLSMVGAFFKKKNEEFVKSYGLTIEKVEEANTRVFTKMKGEVKTTAKVVQEEMTKSTDRWSSDLAQKLSSSQNAFKSFGDFATSILNQVSQALIKKNVTDPLVGNIFDSLKLPGLASGGTAEANKPHIVGEKGPELFIPNTTGTVVPNHQLGMAGGGAITINQSFNISSGAEVNLIDEKIRNAAPVIAGVAQEGVFTALRRGGVESKLVGRRR